MEEEEEIPCCCCCSEVHLSGAVGEGGVDEAGSQGKGEALGAVGGAAVHDDDLEVGVVDFEAVFLWVVVVVFLEEEEGREDRLLLRRGVGGGDDGAAAA